MEMNCVVIPRVRTKCIDATISKELFDTFKSFQKNDYYTHIILCSEAVVGFIVEKKIDGLCMKFAFTSIAGGVYCSLVGKTVDRKMSHIYVFSSKDNVSSNTNGIHLVDYTVAEPKDIQTHFETVQYNVFLEHMKEKYKDYPFEDIVFIINEDLEDDFQFYVKWQKNREGQFDVIDGIVGVMR